MTTSSNHQASSSARAAVIARHFLAPAAVNGGSKRHDGFMLTAEQLRRFHEDGFLVLENIFPSEDLEPLKDVLQAWSNDVVTELLELGELQEGFEGQGLDTRLAKVNEAIPGIAMYLQTSFMKDRVRVMKRDEFQNLRANPRLLDALGQLLDTQELAAHPNFTMRIRTPSPPQESEYADRGLTPWHQDAGYLLEDAANTTVLGVWLPLQAVSKQKMNGPMQFVRGAHKEKRCLTHMQGNTYLLLEPSEFQKEFGHLDIVTPEIPEGGCVIFNNFTPHQSLQNATDSVRWSFDMRYQDARLPHGMGKNGGLIQLRSADPNFQRSWVEGPKGPTDGVLGSYSRKATIAALEAFKDTEMKKSRNPTSVKAFNLVCAKPGDAPTFQESSNSK